MNLFVLHPVTHVCNRLITRLSDGLFVYLSTFRFFIASLIWTVCPCLSRNVWNGRRFRVGSVSLSVQEEEVIQICSLVCWMILFRLYVKLINKDIVHSFKLIFIVIISQNVPKILYVQVIDHYHNDKKK